MFELIGTMLFGGQIDMPKTTNTENYQITNINNVDKQQNIKSVTVYVQTTKTKNTHYKNSKPESEEIQEDDEIEFEFVN